MKAVKEILDLFSPISLGEMDAVTLLDRMDTKFIFDINLLPDILLELKDQYRVLEVNSNHISRYETLYFDTEDHRLYIQHHNGKADRYKVRFRRYVDTDINFFEIKFKNNKGRTIKDRVKRNYFHEDIQGKSERLLEKITPLNADNLKPTLWVYYSRITLVSTISTERLTIDIGISYKNSEKTEAYPHLVIAEVKQPKAIKSPFIILMRQHHIFERKLSKYCLGMYSLNQQLKHNNFKHNFNYITKHYHDSIE